MKRKGQPLDKGTSLLVKFEVRRDSLCIHSDTTFGKKGWIDHPQFSGQNTLKRVKSAMGMKWSVKTEKADGDGDIVRKFEDGRTLHIWIVQDGEKPLNKTINAQVEQKPEDSAAGYDLNDIDEAIRYNAQHVHLGNYDIDWALRALKGRDTDEALRVMLRDAIDMYDAGIYEIRDY